MCGKLECAVSTSRAAHYVTQFSERMASPVSLRAHATAGGRVRVRVCAACLGYVGVCERVLAFVGVSGAYVGCVGMCGVCGRVWDVCVVFVVRVGCVWGM